MDRKRFAPALLLLPLLLCLLGLGARALVFVVSRSRTQATAVSPFAKWLADSPADSGEAALPLAIDAYHHPSGAFDVAYPEGWQIDESEDTALFTAPDDSAQFAVNVVAVDPALQLSAYADTQLRGAWDDLPNFAIDGTRVVGEASFRQWSAAFGFDQTVLPDRRVTHVRGVAVVEIRTGWAFTQTYLARDGSPQALVSAFQTIAESLQIHPPDQRGESE
jgi:hypothetical protein